MTTFDYDKLAAFDKVVIEYSGSNDEGYINDIKAEPPSDSLKYGTDLYGEVEATAYDLLQQHFGGWEINEGSHGEIIVNVKERKVLLHHGWTVESTRWEDKEVS